MITTPLKYDSEIVKRNGILLLRRMRDSPISTIKRKGGMIPLASLMYLNEVNDRIYCETIGMYARSNVFGVDKNQVSYRHLIGYND